MISGPGSNGGMAIAPSLIVSPRNIPTHQGYNIIPSQGYQNGHGGFQQELNRPQLNVKPQGNGSSGLLKRFNQNGSEVPFIMSKGVEYC